MEMTIKTKRKYRLADELLNDTEYEMLGIVKNLTTNSGISIMVEVNESSLLCDSSFFRMNSIKIN